MDVQKEGALQCSREFTLHLQLFKFFITILTVRLLKSFLRTANRKIKKLRKRNPTALHNLSNSDNTFTVNAFHQ